MPGIRKRFPRNSYVIRLELMADDLRTWAGIYEASTKPAVAGKHPIPALAKYIDRRDTCRMAADLVEKAAVEIYRLW